jgi:hypothetical protein
MGQPVQHEQPDYEYKPTGLMAEEWGKAGTRTEPPAFVREDILRQRHYMDNDRSRDALMYVLSLDDATLLAAADDGSEANGEICRRLSQDGAWTNPSWVTGACATEAYERGLIDEREFDRLSDA